MQLKSSAPIHLPQNQNLALISASTKRCQQVLFSASPPTGEETQSRITGTKSPNPTEHHVAGRGSGCIQLIQIWVSPRDCALLLLMLTANGLHRSMPRDRCGLWPVLLPAAWATQNPDEVYVSTSSPTGFSPGHAWLIMLSQSLQPSLHASVYITSSLSLRNSASIQPNNAPQDIR